MSDGFCFISYSHLDGLDFVIKLAGELEGGHPFIPVWFERRDMAASKDNWDDELAIAIRNCKCLLYVMSKDSTAGHSYSLDEWTWALKYKKPVICLWIDNKAEDQFRLNNRHKVDFTTNFDAGLAKLRKAIAHLDSPEGQLEELNYRLSDANRDLRRAKSEDQARIQSDIDELKKQIEIQQKIVANPQDAEKQTQENITAGLERERRTESRLSNIVQTKFINPPPGIAPIYFQNRSVETKQIVEFLNDDSQRLMTIVGRGGVGKTAMVCRLLKGLESGELPDGLGTMKVDGIVYLSESGSHRVNFANLFYDLCKLLPSDIAQELDAVYKNPQVRVESKMRAMLEKFGSGRVVLLLDNFETLVDTETSAIRDAELDEALRAFLNGTHTAVKVALTTRVAPRLLNLIQPGRQRVLTLDEGLESPYAENILREMDNDGRMGLKFAPDEILKHARERTRGYPRALEALFAILTSDRYTTLEELLDKPLPENVLETLVGEAFNRLDSNAQKVMQGLAIYNRPVTPAAVDYLLAPHIPTIDSARILQRLANMHFARKESGRFYLHPVDREFAFGLLTKGDELSFNDYKQEQVVNEFGIQPPRKGRNDFTQLGLTDRAARYYAQARKPRKEWKKLNDLSAQLAEFDLRCAVGNYDAAASVLLDFDFDYLLLWGHYRLMIDLHESLQGKIKDLTLARISIGNLGQALGSIGNIKKAVSNYERALSMARETKNRHAESVWLGNLGKAYADLGDTRKAIEFHEQYLSISREIENRQGEGNALGNLGSAYADLGDTHKAIDFYRQYLAISREVGNRQGEGNALGNLGSAYANLGIIQKAIEFYEQALIIDREIGDRRGESADLGNLGLAYANLGDTRQGIEYHEQALFIAREIGDKISQRNHLGSLGNSYLTIGNLHKSFISYQNALDISREIGNKFSEILFLSRLGFVNAKTGDIETALRSFEEALQIANQINDIVKIKLISEQIEKIKQIINAPERITELKLITLEDIDKLGNTKTIAVGEEK